MLAEMTCAQYEELYQFWTISPWGGARDDYRAGLLAMVGQAPWTKGTPMRPEEWFPNLKEDDAVAHLEAATTAPPREGPKTPQELAAALKDWAVATGGGVYPAPPA